LDQLSTKLERLTLVVVLLINRTNIEIRNLLVEDVSARSRRHNVGIVEMTIDSLRCNLLSNERVLILKEKGAERYLPIYIGPQQANIVEKLLLGSGRIDPAELDLFSEGIDIISCKVEAAVINWFADNVYYAKLLLTRDNKQTIEVDCAPAKAVAHGIMAEAPIFADERVLDKAGITINAQ
jgi:bifunctional DNase/RNase